VRVRFYSTCGQCKSATSVFVFDKSVAVLQRQLRDDFGRTGKTQPTGVECHVVKGWAVNLGVEVAPHVAASCLVLPNLSRAIQGLKAHGLSVGDNLLEHLSPLGWEHINLTGDYVWRQNRRVESGNFDPFDLFSFPNVRFFPFREVRRITSSYRWPCAEKQRSIPLRAPGPAMTKSRRLHKPAYSAEFWTRAWRCCEAICAMASAVRAKPNRPVLSVTS
jgi:hypothetical protein